MKKHAACAAALATLCLQQAHAGFDQYVHTPAVEYGEREIDFRFGSGRAPHEERESAAVLGFGYGVTQSWFTELYGKWQRADGDTRFDAVEWENKFQLTETGKYPVDVGFLVEIERPQEHAEGWEVKAGPLFQTDLGTKVQVNANVLFERHFDTKGAEEKSETELGYEWQVKYRWLPQFEFGAQGFGEVGKWDDWEPKSEQEHKAGPAVFGKIPLGGRHELEYNAAYLVGLNHASPDHGVRVQVEYEF